MKYVAAVAVGALCLVAVGCGKSADKRAEDALKQQGITAKIDSSAGKVEVQTQEGTLSVSGASGKLVDAFPKDVYVYEGAKVMASAVNGPGCAATLQSSDAMDKIAAAYKAKMKENGWKELASSNLGQQVALSYQKDTRTAGITLSSANGVTTIAIGITDTKM